ncbi:MAG: heme-binding domain-containing protein [Agriterribacter sp.]
MKTLKKIGWILLMLFFLIQFFAPEKNIDPLQTDMHIRSIYAMPASVEAILQKACYDCHSNNTVYPWYTNIQPVGWMMNNHITEGKDDLNLSEFGTYSKRKQESKLKSMANQVKDDKMPLNSYQWLHPEASLDSTEKQMLVHWAEQTIAFIKASK